jgi:hypothetical protein
MSKWLEVISPEQVEHLKEAQLTNTPTLKQFLADRDHQRGAGSEGCAICAEIEKLIFENKG